ncbi:MAG: hypothetical protein D6714_17905 [Bacteroidetes bacterium]|nr:MAG: hypothetical protein D6714_17905 [Bacteroidota bacterium]
MRARFFHRSFAGLACFFGGKIEWFVLFHGGHSFHFYRPGGAGFDQKKDVAPVGTRKEVIPAQSGLCVFIRPKPAPKKAQMTKPVAGAKKQTTPFFLPKKDKKCPVGARQITRNWQSKWPSR